MKKIFTMQEQIDKTSQKLAARSAGYQESMKVADMIRDALEKNGIRTIYEAAKALDLSPELLRLTVYKGHIPKDKTLAVIASKLSMDSSVLILAAHQTKVPTDVKGFFLEPNDTKYSSGKRRFPLSEEQCDYLARIMSPEEIQLVRMLRQITDDGKTQIHGFVRFAFNNMRKSTPERSLVCGSPVAIEE